MIAGHGIILQSNRNGEDMPLQWVAILTMLLDHIGLVWFPESPVWRVIGRLAFPIYTYYIAAGLSSTKDRKAYVLRLALLALASQIPFSLLFQTWSINVIGTFLFSVLAIYAMEQNPESPFRFAWAAATAVLLELFAFDYGAYGLLLLLIYRYTAGNAMWLGHLGLNLLYWILFGLPLQMFSIFPTFIFAFIAGFPSSSAFYLAPRWVWRAFYPAHLLALFLIAAWVKL